MEKIPLYSSFKNFGITQIAHIKQAWINGEWWWLIAYFFIVIVILTTIVFFIIGNVVSGIEAVGLIEKNVNAPKKTLQYYDKREEKTEDGKHRTTFVLKSSSPLGDAGEMNLISYPPGCDFDGKETITSGGMETKNRTIYAIDEYKITCITDEPLTESSTKDLLFKLEK